MVARRTEAGELTSPPGAGMRSGVNPVELLRHLAERLWALARDAGLATTLLAVPVMLAIAALLA